jgi:hypothetical protein
MRLVSKGTKIEGHHFNFNKHTSSIPLRALKFYN